MAVDICWSRKTKIVPRRPGRTANGASHQYVTDSGFINHSLQPCNRSAAHTNSSHNSKGIPSGAHTSANVKATPTDVSNIIIIAKAINYGIVPVQQPHSDLVYSQKFVNSSLCQSYPSAFFVKVNPNIVISSNFIHDFFWVILFTHTYIHTQTRPIT